jgi:hypothetical protein
MALFALYLSGMLVLHKCSRAVLFGKQADFVGMKAPARYGSVAPQGTGTQKSIYLLPTSLSYGIL